jgi:hypothetical protein
MHLWTRAAIGLVIGTAMHLSPRVAVAQASNAEAWFLREWNAAPKDLAFPGVRLSFCEEWPCDLSAADVARLRFEAQGKPDHPNWDSIRTFERVQRQGADADCFDLWVEGPGRWRFNRSLNYQEPGYFNDIASVEGVAWSLTPTQLTIVDPRAPAVTSPNLLVWGRVFSRNLGLLMYGGLSLRHSLELRVQRFHETAGGSWEVLAEGPSGVSAIFKGTWDVQTGEGAVRTLHIANCAQTPQIEGEYAFEDARYDNVLHRRVAGAVTHRQNRAVVRTLRFVGASSDSQPFSALVRLPDVSGQDPVRGRITVRSVYDHRPGIEQYKELADSVSTVATLPERGGDRRAGDLRILGWVTAGSIAAILIGLRLRRSRVSG